MGRKFIPEYNNKYIVHSEASESCLQLLLEHLISAVGSKKRQSTVHVLSILKLVFIGTDVFSYTKLMFCHTAFIENIEKSLKECTVSWWLSWFGEWCEDTGPSPQRMMRGHCDGLLEEVFTKVEKKYWDIEETNVCNDMGSHLMRNV